MCTIGILEKLILKGYFITIGPRQHCCDLSSFQGLYSLRHKTSKYLSCKIGCYNRCVTLKFIRCPKKTPVKFQGNTSILRPNRKTLQELRIRQKSFHLVNREALSSLWRSVCTEPLHVKSDLHVYRHKSLSQGLNPLNCQERKIPLSMLRVFHVCLIHMATGKLQQSYL